MCGRGPPTRLSRVCERMGACSDLGTQSRSLTFFLAWAYQCLRTRVSLFPSPVSRGRADCPSLAPLLAASGALPFAPCGANPGRGRICFSETSTFFWGSTSSDPKISTSSPQLRGEPVSAATRFSVSPPQLRGTRRAGAAHGALGAPGPSARPRRRLPQVCAAPAPGHQPDRRPPAPPPPACAALSPSTRFKKRRCVSGLFNKSFFYPGRSLSPLVESSRSARV